MRINMGGSDASGDTRSLEVRTLITAAQARAKDYETLKTQFQELKTAFQQITGLGRAFQGKGADAIKQFYRAQADVIDTWLDLIDQQIAYYRSIPGAIDKKHLDGQTSVQVPFLEDDLATGYYRSKEIIVQQREAVRKILSRISDLVPLTVFSNHAVDQALDQAEDERRKMATDTRDLDQQLTAEYQKATEGLPRVATLYGELIHATRQGAEVQPMHFNAEAFHASEAYQLYNEGQKQRKAQEARMEKEAEANLPFDLKMKLMENKIERGIGQGLIDTITDTIGGIVETARHPIQTSVAFYQALSNWNLTSALLAQSISGSYERNMVHGDASTRSRWITYALATIATSAFGSKGMDKVGKAVDVEKLESMASRTVTKVGKAAGKWTQARVNQAASRVSGKMSYFEMPRLGPEPVLAGENYLPYHNVVNSAGIKAKLSELAKGKGESSFFDQVNNVRNLIQQTSVRKVSSASNKDNISSYKYSFNTNSFSGTLKGDNVTLENIYFENIKYTKRDREELRKKFDSSVRSNFAKNLVSNEYLINSLKNSGLSNSDISMLKLGKIPRGYNVHHKLPLDDGGTNDFSNLVLIKNHPYHKILTKYQIAKTGHMQEGDSIELKWPIPKKYIYPFGKARKED